MVPSNAVDAKDKNCPATTTNLKAFNSYVHNKQQDDKKGNNVNYSDAKTSSNLARDAVSWSCSRSYLLNITISFRLVLR